MRRTRRLILLLILAIAAAVGFIYIKQKTSQAKAAPPIPDWLPTGTSAKLNGWTFTKDDGNRSVFRIHAKDMRETSEGNRFELEGVDLRVFHKTNDAFDQVRSEKALFDKSDGVLYSEGDVEITLGVPSGDAPKPNGKLLVIKSSGVRYDSRTGKAFTERAAAFTFDRGEGSATGAEYDPVTGELRMFKDVSLTWHPRTAKGKTMKVEAGALIYKEKESKVLLSPWSRLKRDTLTLDAADSTVFLNQGVIQLVDAQKAHGVDLDPKRRLDYAADQLRMNFDEDGIVRTITGENNAQLLSTSATASTTITATRVDMEFDTSGDSSTLQKATSRGKSVVESKPIPRPNAQPQQETKIMRSEVIQVNMRPGGQEIQTVETHTPGSLEFVPNAPGQKHRFLNGERFWITYGAQNQIESFRAVTAMTRTESEQVKGKPPIPPAITSSKDLLAEFEPKSGTLIKLEQWNDFRYEAGDRKARTDRAVLDYAKNSITLTGPASRVWDPAGSTSADKILLNQKTGDFEAIGNVSSTRVPEKKKDASGMLSGDEPIQAKAGRMTSTDDNLQIHYDGNAIVWQGPNRLQADRIFIDRDDEKLEAHGNVVSQFLDKSSATKSPAPKTPAKAAVFTTIKAPDMTYVDSERVAHYTNGVSLNRPGLDVQSRELRSYLKSAEAGSGSGLDKAIADGAVKIVQSSPGRKRIGTSEHAEYYVDEAKVVLQNGQPQLVDSLRGTTKGKQLTWFSNNDRLLVDGAANQPAESNIRRK